MFAYGPEFDLKGLVVNGKQINFDSTSRNFLAITVASGTGSCPYLYAWDQRNNAWSWRGKVIHDANAKEKELTQQIVFEGYVSKFRLAEEELELSFIDQIGLTVRLIDGTQHALRPENELLMYADGKYAKIRAGQALEFHFDLPSEIKPEAVVVSTLAIRGYYQRYFVIGAAERPRGSTPRGLWRNSK